MAVEAAAVVGAVAAVADRPILGAGISFRDEWSWEIVRHRDRLGLVEVVPENVVGERGCRDVHVLRDAVPLLVHGIGLSLGGAEGIDPARLEHFARIVELARPPWISEHIAFTRAGGVDVGHLTPLPFTREAVDMVARNVAALRRRIPDVPLLLENIAYTVRLPGAEMTEAEFVTAVVETADCGLLLDLENVHANATNHGYDARTFLEALPLERVGEVHLAGGQWVDDRYADTHTRAVPEESWALLEWLVQRVRVPAVVIERDDELPPFLELLNEVDRAREILDHAAARAAASAGR